MSVPNLTCEQVAKIIPNASNIEALDQGGQKIVFTGKIDSKSYVLKFMSTGSNLNRDDDIFNITERAKREVETLAQCICPNLVKMGPIGLNAYTLEGQYLLYFSEELIDGENIRSYYNEIGNFSEEELIRLSFDISEAIKALWQFSKIHRDIKPGNIMRSNKDGKFILLDMGLVFDLQDDSLSMGPVGTPRYFSPEHVDFLNRRTRMDFRSDLFSLGVVMYEMATGVHPFATTTSFSNWDIIGNIIKLNPPAPISIRHDLNPKLSDLIMRLIAKRPALRYRSIGLFQNALNALK
jgi:eukaryotic-like serine/threonine-protein kinase